MEKGKKSSSSLLYFLAIIFFFGPNLFSHLAIFYSVVLHTSIRNSSFFFLCLSLFFPHKVHPSHPPLPSIYFFHEKRKGKKKTTKRSKLHQTEVLKRKFLGLSLINSVFRLYIRLFSSSISLNNLTNQEVCDMTYVF